MRGASECGNRSRLGVRLAAGLVVLAAQTSCDGDRSPRAPGSPEPAAAAVETSSEALGIVARLRDRSASPLGKGRAEGFQTGRDGLLPKFPAGGERETAHVVLPKLGASPIRLEDAATGLAIDITMDGARPVAALAGQGYVVYPKAHASGATLLHHALPSGLEDFVSFEERPATSEVSYRVALGKGVQGLRLVAGTLEVIDESGTPRLRAAPPYLVGADGLTTDATLAVAGCAVDTNPAAPWGRPPIDPGATSCTVRVTWSDAAVVYPAVLDPRWTTTNSMGWPRLDHIAVLLSSGKVLVAAGRAATTTTTDTLASAELYDRTTGTWATTNPIPGARRLATAVQLGTTSSSTTSGKVLVVGGHNGATTLNTAQLYSASAGTWVAATNLNAARHGHSATVLANGRVLVAGGLNGTTTLATAAVYNPSSGAGSWTATSGLIPGAGLREHTATLLVTSNATLSNKVLLVGGNNGTSTVSSVFLYDPTATTFATQTSLSGTREGHTATRLANGNLLVAGGRSGGSTLSSTWMFNPSSGSGTWTSVGSMSNSRSGHTATLLNSGILSDGSVLVAGGSNANGTQSTVDLFNGTSWVATTALPQPVYGHTATLMGNGQVLIAGGRNINTVVEAAHIYDPSFAKTCTSNSQCSTGFCANGVCCDSACNGGCGACNLPNLVGTCSPLTNITICRAAAGACDVVEVCNGTSLSCPANVRQPAGFVCRASAGACDPAETCTGTSSTCPTNAFSNAQTTCRPAADSCDVAELCPGNAAACPADVLRPAGFACRPSAGVCDVAETCSGTSPICPTNVLLDGRTPCRSAGGPCDIEERCNGVSPNCAADALQPAGVVCRPSAGVCDVTETCNGTGTQCPADTFLDGRSACRSAGGPCDIEERCNGASPDCAPDARQPSTTVCRPAAGVCDAPETCNGGTQCPADVMLPTSTVCRPGGTCNPQELCNGTPNCPADVLTPAGTACSMPNATATCNGQGTCTRTKCNNGFDDCNGSAGDGCEASLTTSPNCGVCGNQCVYGTTNPFCKNLFCNCTSALCFTHNDANFSVVKESDISMVLSGYGVVPGDTITVQALRDQVAQNPFFCNLSSPGWLTVGTAVTATTPSFSGGGKQLYLWSMNMSVPGLSGGFQVWPEGGVARLRVIYQSTGNPVNAAAFEDPGCVSQHAAEPFQSIISACASTSTVALCPGFSYQIVTLVDASPTPADAPITASAAPFCPTQRGHWIYGKNVNQQPDLTATGCNYAAEGDLYYNSIDPGRTRTSLPAWKTQNRYPGAGSSAVTRAVYYNSGDLGVGRDMYCWKPNPASDNGATIACFVTNYGASFVSPPFTIEAAMTQVIGGNPNDIAATVAMEYVPGSSDPIRFFVFGGNGARLTTVKLDSEGAKPVPGNCITCHGGRYDGGQHKVIDANFLPFDPAAFIFSQQHPYTLGDQEEKFRVLNKLVLETQPETRKGAAIKVLLEGFYNHGGGTVDTPLQKIDQAWVHPAWQTAGLSKLYLDVVRPYCRGCHVSRDAFADTTTTPTNNPSFALAYAGALNYACPSQSSGGSQQKHFMPHAEATMKRFWSTSARATLISSISDGRLGAAASQTGSPPALGCSP